MKKLPEHYEVHTSLGLHNVVIKMNALLNKFEERLQKGVKSKDAGLIELF